MRYRKTWVGIGAVLVAASAAVAGAGQVRDATNKASGDWPVQEQSRVTNRSFSYAPTPVVAAPAQNPAPANAIVQNNGSAVRSYSYQPQNGVIQLNAPAVVQPRYLRGASKALGNY